MKTTRDLNTSKELDEQEHRWWNEHAKLVSQVWEMHPEVSWAIRKPYLKRAKAFLSENRDQVVALEIGCGSGWVGQSIAGPGFQIMGVDFSESQISLARSRARARRLEPYCHYLDATSARWENIFNTANGVIIHSFLHHLNGSEITSQLSLIKERLKKGTRLFIYEPAFFLNRGEEPDEKKSLGYLDRKIFERAKRTVDWFHEKLSRAQWMDTNTAGNFLQLAEQSRRDGWYLSPKEVPFDVSDFTEQLSRYFFVKSNYCATLFMVEWVQDFNLIHSNILRNTLSRTVLPLLRMTDSRLAQKQDFLKSRLQPPGYAFFVWECEV